MSSFSTASDHRFPETQWTQIRRIQGGDEGQVRDALEEVCRSYWFPLYHFLRFQGDSPEQAEDIVQGFFARMLEKEWLQTMQAGGGDDGNSQVGRLRTFLLTCLKGYRAKEYRRENAQRRGGSIAHLSIDRDEAEARHADLNSGDRTPDQLFDRAWAREILGLARSALREKYRRRDAGDLFNALEPFLGWSAGGESYQKIAASLGVSEGKIKTDVFRMRKNFRDEIRRVIAETLDTGKGVSIDEELNHLLAALG